MATLAFEHASVRAGGKTLVVEWKHSASLGSVVPWDESTTPTLTASGGAVSLTFVGLKQEDLISESKTLVSGVWALSRVIAQTETVTIGSGASSVGTDGTNTLGAITDGSHVMVISFVDADGEIDVPLRVGAPPGTKTDPVSDNTNAVMLFRASSLGLSDGAPLNTNTWLNGTGSNNITFGAGGTYRAAHADYGGQPALDWGGATETLTVGTLTLDCTTPLTLVVYLGYQTSTSTRSLRFGGSVAVNLGAQGTAPMPDCQLCTATNNNTSGGYAWADYTRPNMIILRWDPASGVLTWFDRCGQVSKVVTGLSSDTPSGQVQIFIRGTLAEFHAWQEVKTNAQIAEYARWILDHYQDTARVFYLDPAGGSDANNGLSSGTPKQTMAQIVSTLFSQGGGDHLLIKHGTNVTLAATIPTNIAGGPPEYPTYFDAYGDPGDGPVILNLPEAAAFSAITLQSSISNYIFGYNLRITSEVDRNPDSGSFVGYSSLTGTRSAFSLSGSTSAPHPLGHLTFMSDCRWLSHHTQELNCGTNNPRDNLIVQNLRARAAFPYYARSSFSTSPRPAGIYIQGCRSATFHQSAFLRCGWCPELVRSVSITSIGTGNPSTVTLSANHDFTTDTPANELFVTITGSDSTPSIDGTHIATRTGATSFTIPLSVTGAGSTGTASWQPSLNNGLNHGIYYDSSTPTYTTTGAVTLSECLVVGNGSHGAQFRAGVFAWDNIFERNGNHQTASANMSFVTYNFYGPNIPEWAITGGNPTSRDWALEFTNSASIEVYARYNIFYSDNAELDPNGGNCIQINVSGTQKRITVERNTFALWPGWCVEFDRASGTFNPDTVVLTRNICSQPSNLTGGEPQYILVFDQSSLSSFVASSYNAIDPTATGAASAVFENGSTVNLATYLSGIGDTTSVQNATITFTELRTVTAANAAANWHASMVSGTGDVRDFVDDWLAAMSSGWDPAWAPLAILDWIRAGFTPTSLDVADYGDGYVGAVEWGPPPPPPPPPPPSPRWRAASPGRLLAVGVIGEQEVYAQ